MYFYMYYRLVDIHTDSKVDWINICQKDLLWRNKIKLHTMYKWMDR